MARSVSLSEIKESIYNLKVGEYFIWPESDYGRAEIRKENGKYYVGEIPMYGGLPYPEVVCDTVDDVISMVSGWN